MLRPVHASDIEQCPHCGLKIMGFVMPQNEQEMATFHICPKCRMNLFDPRDETVYRHPASYQQT